MKFRARSLILSAVPVADLLAGARPGWANNAIARGDLRIGYCRICVHGRWRFGRDMLCWDGSRIFVVSARDFAALYDLAAQQ